MTSTLEIPEHLFVCIDHVGVAVPDLDEALRLAGNQDELATFEGIEEKTSKRDGAPYWRWSFVTNAGDHLFVVVNAACKDADGVIGAGRRALEGLWTV